MDITQNPLEVFEGLRQEHQAWIAMCGEIEKTFGISKEEFNKDKYKAMVRAIEKWGIEFNKSMQAQGIAEPKGLFQEASQ